MARDYLVILLLTLTVAAGAKPMAFRQAGLTEEEAAAHLLSRFTFGPRPGQVEQVVQVGLERWFESQLKGLVPETLPPAEANIWSLRQAKAWRAVNSPNQLREVLTDFWFNHFNVNAQGLVVRATPDYEAVIREHSLGTFYELLSATAHHPAMLIYLNNNDSRAPPEPMGEPDRMKKDRLGYGPASKFSERETDPLGYGPPRSKTVTSVSEPRREGINENYARELMELHTLGVDGGYCQQDVIEVARALTGWTVRFEGEAAPVFVYDDSIHDHGPKTVLGHRFPGSEGQQEGERILEMLCNHHATARHLSRKLAVRFVSDDPPKKLVDRLARRFLGTGGNVAHLLRELVASPEFWQARRQKVKTPFEVAISAVRALDGEVTNLQVLLTRVEQMGQPLYAYEAPTGFPDRADYWINPGSLVARMTFGLDLAENHISGVRVDLSGVKAETNASKALRQQAQEILPGRPLEKLLKSLVPSLEDPDFAERVRSKHRGQEKTLRSKRARPRSFRPERVVGILLGSPEFQRR